MNFEIKGGTLPVVEVKMNAGEKIICEAGSMVWRSGNFEQETRSDAVGAKGFGNVMKRLFSGANLFQNVFTCCNGEGLITFGSKVPGSIVQVELDHGEEIICQSGAFLACTEGISLEAFSSTSYKGGLWAGEGWYLQKLSGKGTVFIEIDGSYLEYNLKAGEQMIIDQGHIGTISASCTLGIEKVKGIKNIFFGGHGWFNAVVTGPGKVGLQTMPISKLAKSIARYLPKESSDRSGGSSHATGDFS